MAGRDESKNIIKLLSGRFPSLDFPAFPENLAGWQSVLDGMTNAQVAVAEHYLNHEYRGKWPPQPADFRAWALESARQETRWSADSKRGSVLFSLDDLGRSIAQARETEDRIVPLRIKRDYVPEEISQEECELRLRTIFGIFSGTMHRDIDWRNFADLKESNVSHRAWLREKLGWSPHT